MPLEALQTAERIVALGGEGFREIADHPGGAGLIGVLALVVAIVLQLHGPETIERQVVPHSIASLEHQALIAPLRQIRVPEDPVGASLGARAYGEATYVWRSTGSLIEDFIEQPNGFTDVSRNGVDYGTFTKKEISVFQLGFRTHRPRLADAVGVDRQEEPCAVFAC